MKALERNTASQSWNIERVRRDFPLLSAPSRGKPLIYLDNAATTQKPQAVIDAVSHYYAAENANIHRGVYALSESATALHESVREKVRQFINAAEAAEIIFVRGTTEAINLVASSWGRANLKPGDEIIISELEHHSNIVPWQIACELSGAALKIIPIDANGELDMDTYRRLLSTGRVKMVAVNHVSNALGTINPVAEIIRLAHQAGAVALIDAAQWVAHGATDVRKLDADFYAFSGHKMMGPTGIGVLYGKRAQLESMPPWQGGGDMIESVHFEKTIYAGLPNKFEAGTPHMAGVAGLGAAIHYLTALGLENAGRYEHELLTHATDRLQSIPGLQIIGTAPLDRKASVISFTLAGMSSLDIGLALDRRGICVRTGHHCCQPVMEHFGIGSTARASLAFYNSRAEIDALATVLSELAVAAHSRAPAPASAISNGAIAYPPASATSIAAAADSLAEEFAFLSEREAKNEYVLDMAARLPRLFDQLSKVTDRVPGCMSQVYLVGRKKPDANGDGTIFEFVADADADIVRGLIALLERLYSGQRAGEVADFDVEAFFQRIGLDQFITSQRRNGLAGMIAKIRESARRIAAQP